mgnify:CR=1 FL=1
MENPTIKVHVDDENELYEKFDEDQRLLSGALISYLTNQHNKNRHGDVPTICVVSSVPIDEEKLKSALDTTIEQAMEQNRHARRHQRFSELYLFLIGLVCIVAGFALSNITGVVYLQLLSLTAGFAIKEAANIQFLVLPKIIMEDRRLKFIARGRLEFTYKHNG